LRLTLVEAADSDPEGDRFACRDSEAFAAQAHAAI